MISFFLNDQPISTSEAPASALLDFVRYHEQLKGTKIGCREGDCGACTVLVGELAADGQTVSYQSMTSCLTPLGNAHGKHIVTVEGINAAGQQLTPVQQAIVDEGGSQCGFCTVGFVMSLTGHSLSSQPATEKKHYCVHRRQHLPLHGLQVAGARRRQTHRRAGSPPD
ncbi:MAG: 2Fe-2S iron-sulfur cluster-binding protein [Bacteroidota bacterium]|nr:2Fe-2S iron-sulfur cluster-binding protein [Bacteroidota bacterium]